MDDTGLVSTAVEKGKTVRWTELFADLDAQARSLERAERDGEVADRTRAELGRVSLVNRLRGVEGRDVSLRVTGAGQVTGRLDRMGVDWLLLACPHEVVVPVAAILSATDLPWAPVSPEAVGVVESRLTLSSVLRAIAVDRSRVVVVLRDGTTIAGTPDRVGSDFFDVAAHDDVAPRAAAVRARTTVPYAAIGTVSRESAGWS